MTIELPIPFLGVASSLTGRRWVGPGLELDRRALALTQATGVAEPVARILARRGVDAAEADRFLAPALRDLLPDPSRLRDMDAVAERLARAIAWSERIAIFADYDVDGGASAALLIRYLRALGLSATLYVPDRIAEGYGPNAPAMARLGAAHDLIVCVDCGTLAHGPIAAAGCDVVVLDHHQGDETVPDALVVNPNRADEDGSLGHLCAAGVVFLALVALNRLRRAEGLSAPDLMGLLDLVALATVADVAPLVGCNRALVRQGLKVMARRANPGLAALSDAAGLTAAPTAHSLGFALGPRINAGGRIGGADLGARLMATECPSEAAALAAKLDGLNAERREIEAAVRAEALAQAEAQDGPLVWAAGEGWHPGVVGIVAARMAEAFNRPAICLGISGDRAQGSGRSRAGIDLGAAVAQATREGTLLKGGGHAMAAGLTVGAEALPGAMDRLAALVARRGADRLGPPDLLLEGALTPGAATPELVAALEAAGPYGAGAPAPLFALPGATVRAVRSVGAGHLILRLDGGLEAVAFGAADTPLGTLSAGRVAHLAGRQELADWGGRRRARLRLEDAAPA